MCSTTGERIARIGVAIDELAAAARQTEAGSRHDRESRAGQASQAGQGDDVPGQADDVSGRLAQLWAMVAELDPELAKRLPRYLA